MQVISPIDSTKDDLPTLQGECSTSEKLEMGGDTVIRIFFRKLEGSIDFSPVRHPRLFSDGEDLIVSYYGHLPDITDAEAGRAVLMLTGVGATVVSLIYPLCSIKEIRWVE